MKAIFTNYGQRLISLYVPDSKGKLDDVVLGFKSLDAYQTAKEKYFGAVIGRYGNRIKKGKFTLKDTTYQLALNNGNNHIHGGVKGFESVVWNVAKHTKNELVFTRVSPHMEEGYPGNLQLRVIYRLTKDNELKISYEATSDMTTIINLTHHSFFNLKGEGNGSTTDHILTINADNFLPVDEELIPFGHIEPVAGTPFDFRKAKSIDQDLSGNNRQLQMGNGYDHCFVLNSEPKNEAGLVFAAKAEEARSGRTMEVYTNEPGIQFYGGNFLNGKTFGKSGKPYVFRGAFCLETQHFPDAPNQPSFPTVVLNPEETYRSHCVYKFGIAD